MPSERNIPIKTAIYYHDLGVEEGKAFDLYVDMTGLHKYQTVWNWRSLDLSLLFTVKSRLTYIKRVESMKTLGLASEDINGTLWLVAVRKIRKYKPKEDKLVLVKRNKFLKTNIQNEIIRYKLKVQQYKIKKQVHSAKSSTNCLPLVVTKQIGTESKTYTDMPHYNQSYSCKGIAQLLGYKSSWSGWNTLHQLEALGFVRIYKRYIPLNSPYSQRKSDNLGKPIALVNGKWLRQICSEIEIITSPVKRPVFIRPMTKEQRTVSLFTNDCFD